MEEGNRTVRQSNESTGCATAAVEQSVSTEAVGLVLMKTLRCEALQIPCERLFMQTAAIGSSSSHGAFTMFVTCIRA